MGVITEQDRSLAGYETVQIPGVGQQAGSQGTAMLRRRSGRTAKRAVLYVHCLADSFVPDDLASWYTERGFHFYVADLRPPGAGEDPGSQDPAGQRAPDLAGSIAVLDAMASHLREAEGIDTLVVGAHASGAAIAAVWCNANPADALVLAGPALAAGRGRAARKDGLPPGSRRVLAEAAARLEDGLDIACPVLVLCAGADDDPDQLGRRARRPDRRSGGGLRIPRLGPHVTWLRLDGELTGPLPPAGPESRPFFRELGRWLGAYLSGQFRDQLL
jgi:alpha-beta hydrolase superfamily lysophospholipase